MFKYAARSATLLLPVLALTACGGASENEASDPTPTPSEDSRTPVEVVHASVEATLESESFTIDNSTDLSFQDQGFGLDVDGSVDYAQTIADAVISIDQDGSSTEMEILADGETAWIRLDGSNTPTIPQGKTWVAGEASVLHEGTFTQAGVAGVVLTLLGAEEVEEGETDELDGVAVREFTTTVGYQDAMDAAGDRAAELQSALNYTGAAAESDLEITAWVGEDDVIRSFELDQVPPEGIDMDTSVDLELTDVGQEIEPPQSPDEADVLTGSSAEALLDQLMG